MGIRIELPPSATPIAAVETIMQLFGRENVEVAIEALIERLDHTDGDPDAEDDDDDGCSAGDDQGSARSTTDWRESEDVEYTLPEWHSLARREMFAGRFQGRARDIYGLGLADDSEDADRDEINGDEIDGDLSEDEFMHHMGRGPGCSISDPGGTDGCYDGHP